MNINDYIKLVNNKLDEYLQIEYPQNLFKSMKYTVTLPGKRLRPIMCLETCSMFGGEIENALPSACAIEMLHAQTLIHDDLPCMDNDDFRRGKPSNHKVFGEAIATLAGDALLTFAPQIISKFSENLSPTTKIRVLNEYFNYAGARGVIAGQVLDIESEHSSVKNKEEIIHYLHIHKTSDLFQLAMRTGAIIADADDETLGQITEFAKNFGLAFQIADDILDEISTFKQMGKTLGKDKQQGKLTFVSLYGLEEAKCKLSCTLDYCRDIMREQNFNSEIFNEIIDNLSKRVGL
ncbi:polyprenyl synthetase family protein [bacterium]|nr:polyprenyl synthetase family protein [bacterium]